MVVRGCLWLYAAVQAARACTCLHVALRGCSWLPVPLCGCLWLFVGVCGCPSLYVPAVDGSCSRGLFWTLFSVPIWGPENGPQNEEPQTATHSRLLPVLGLIWGRKTVPVLGPRKQAVGALGNRTPCRCFPQWPLWRRCVADARRTRDRARVVCRTCSYGGFLWTPTAAAARSGARAS